jgi:hypothetical protein
LNTSIAKAAALMIGGFLSLTATLTAAHAGTFDWTITGPAPSLGGLNVTGSGTLTTSDTPTLGGVNNAQTGFLVTGITGTLGGSAVSGLLAPGSFESNDNLVFPISSSVIDTLGLAFENAAGTQIDIFGFYSPGSTDVAPGNNFGEFSSLGFGVGTFTLTEVPVPEPASMALLGAGLFGLGVIRRRRA